MLLRSRYDLHSLTTLKFRNIIMSVDAPDIHVMQADAPNISSTNRSVRRSIKMYGDYIDVDVNVLILNHNC